MDEEENRVPTPKGSDREKMPESTLKIEVKPVDKLSQVGTPKSQRPESSQRKASASKADKRAKILLESPKGNKKEDKDDTETFFNGKLFTGVGYELHITGYLSSTITFKNGKQNGISNEYDENGLVKTNYYWIDGEMCFPT